MDMQCMFSVTRDSWRARNSTSLAFSMCAETRRGLTVQKQAARSGRVNVLPRGVGPRREMGKPNQSNTDPIL